MSFISIAQMMLSGDSHGEWLFRDADWASPVKFGHGQDNVYHKLDGLTVAKNFGFEKVLF